MKIKFAAVIVATSISASGCGPAYRPTADQLEADEFKECLRLASGTPYGGKPGTAVSADVVKECRLFAQRKSPESQ